MDYKFMIIDDDRTCRRMLAKIIEHEGIGEIIGELDTGDQADVVVMQGKPNVVLVDMLLPGQDGVEVVQTLRERGFAGPIVMISQVENKDIVAKAYQAGVDFYIHKPINRVEVISVLRKVLSSDRLSQSLAKVRQSLSFLEDRNNQTSTAEVSSKDNTIRRVLHDLGLAGGMGSRELQWLAEASRNGFGIETLQLKDLYNLIQERYRRDFDEGVDLGTIEQRLRRAAHEAMEHFVAIGKDDFNHPLFEYYAPRYFDYNEMRAKLRGEKAKINLKKFITAFCDEVNVS